MLAGEGIGLTLRAIAEPRTGPLAGGEGDLALMRLPVDAGVGRVNAGVIGRENAVFLIVVQHKVPQQRDHRGDGRKSDGKPVQRKAGGKEHHEEDGKEDQRRTEVGRHEEDQAEQQHKVDSQLCDRPHGVEVVVFLQVTDLLCQHDDKCELDDLRRLDADAEKAQPAGVAGVVAHAEGDQQQQKDHVERAQDLPLVGQHIHVQHGHDHERENAEDERRALHDDILGRVVRRRGARDDDDAENGADEAHHEQENIRPVKKLLCVGHGFFHNGLLSAAAAF